MKFDLKGSVTKADLKGKYVFWDIDGTLAPYRFNGHVGDPNGTPNGMSLQEIEEGIYLQRFPSKFMQKVVLQCEAKQNIVLGHVINQKEIDDKHIWLSKYFPTIHEYLLTFDSEPKYQTLLSYCKEKGINKKDVVYVDDILVYLREAELHGIRSYHISSFLDWEYEN